MSWVDMSPHAVEHNLIAVALRQNTEDTGGGNRQVVLVDPLIGAPTLSLPGGAHTHPTVTQVLWAPRSSFRLFSAGYVLCLHVGLPPPKMY